MDSKVLVIEDDVLLRRAYDRILSKQHDVVSVGSCSDALMEISRTRFDAVVSDIDLPGQSGVDLLRQLRAHNEELRFIFITGCPTQETAQDAVNLGAMGYLTKPVAADALVKIVSKATSASVSSKLTLPSRMVGVTDRFESALSKLWMAYQPIVNVTERKIVGYEALLRTTEPSLGAPPDFISAAEHLGQLDRLGQRIRKTVAETIATATNKNAKFYINVHATDLLDPVFGSDACPLVPFADRIVLEITERASLEVIDDAHARIARLRRRGFALAIDDLGAGYAGLTSVTQLVPEVVKLDMSLVRGVDKSRLQQQFVTSISRACNGLGMLVVTEGVETIEERDTLLSLGCNIHQGYLYGRPSRTLIDPTF
jgi:EAL domain-containing protein (putative c-di-GMP-specific phosphodiesterase class I)